MSDHHRRKRPCTIERTNRHRTDRKLEAHDRSRYPVDVGSALAIKHGERHLAHMSYIPPSCAPKRMASTLSIAALVIEVRAKYGWRDVIGGLRIAARRGRRQLGFEFVASQSQPQIRMPQVERETRGIWEHVCKQTRAVTGEGGAVSRYTHQKHCGFDKRETNTRSLVSRSYL